MQGGCKVEAKIKEIFEFGKTPINQELFLKLINIGEMTNSDFSTYLSLSPLMYKKIYLISSEDGLKQCLYENNDLDALDYYLENRAVFAYNAQIIILYLPNIGKSLNEIQTREDDPEGKIFFTMLMFSCLFHELNHAFYYKKALHDKAIEYDVFMAEEIATEAEGELLNEINEFVNSSKPGWAGLAEVLFDWDVLMPIVNKARGL